MEDFPHIPLKNYSEFRNRIRSGDLLLCSGNSAFSNMIKQVTGSAWSHIAFLVRIDSIDRVMVLESVESIGVRAVPLSSYIYDYNASGKGYAGQLMIARHSAVKQSNIPKLSMTATDLLGLPYNTEEIIRIATRIGMSALGVSHEEKDMINLREFICSEYAYICFKSIGVQIEYNSLGFISPADFARCPDVNPLCFLRTEVLHQKIMAMTERDSRRELA